jgi:hypothetical protein
VALGDTVTDALRRNGFSRARRMLFIVVDARTGFDRQLRAAPEPLGIKKVMDAVVSATFNRYSFETMNLMRARVKRWENEVRNTRWQSALAIPDCDKFDVDLVELSFERVKDAEERDVPRPDPTSFTLAEEIIRLRRAAELLVEGVTRTRALPRAISRGAADSRHSRRSSVVLSRCVGETLAPRSRHAADPTNPGCRQGPCRARPARGQQGGADCQGPEGPAHPVS